MSIKGAMSARYSVQRIELRLRIHFMSRAWKNGTTKGWRVIRLRILARDRCCQLCGQSEGPMHIDHIIPKRLNGSDEDWNLRQLCQNCNLTRERRFFENTFTPPTLHVEISPENVSISHD